MTLSSRLLLLALLGLSGCRQLDGAFEPSCIAFAGERVTFASGRFEWDRFTDERRLDDDGNVVDPFPDYPKSGDYRLDGNRVEFFTDDGERLATRYLLERDDGLYLLEAEQREAVSKGRPLPECALRLDADDR